MNKKMSKLQAWNTITMFCVLIFGFTAATMIKPDEAYSETENRSLAQMPQISLKTVLNGEFEADYEEYLTDQFVARDSWIGLKTNVEQAMLRSESKDIYFAEDGYLIEKHTGAYTSDTAVRNLAMLQQFVQMYQEQYQDHLSVMIVPNAVDILDEKLPALASPFDTERYLQQLAAGLPEGVWFDAGEVLRQHQEEEIFYRTDHHWETLAAFYVYQEWAEQYGHTVPTGEEYEIETVTDSFEGTIQSKLGINAEKDTIEIYKLKHDPLYTVSKNGSEEIEYSVYEYQALDTKSKYDVFFGGNHARVTMRTKADNGKKILVLKDSYAHCFVPFMLEEFEQIDMLDVRYYNQKLSELIAQEQYTDVLVLYNASGFAEDGSISRLIY